MSLKFVPNAKKTAYIQRLVDFFNALHPARIVLTWVEIEAETSIPMRNYAIERMKGRDLVRLALGRIGREYTSIRGSGIELSTASTSTDILVSQRKGVFAKIRRAARAETNLSTRHLGEMTPGERDTFNRESARVATLTMLGPVRQLPPKKD
jgi:hypothetical protein